MYVFEHLNSSLKWSYCSTEADVSVTNERKSCDVLIAKLQEQRRLSEKISQLNTYYTLFL